MIKEHKRPYIEDYIPEPFKEVPLDKLVALTEDQSDYINYQGVKLWGMEAKINKRNKRDGMWIAYLILHKVAIAWCLIEIYN